MGSKTYNFLRGGRAEKEEDLAHHLDRADRITCFNGTRFDIPFLQERLGFPPQRVGAWVMKMFDVYDIARGVLRHSFKLDTVLALNGIATKSASGADAVRWAADPARWGDLESYCLQDTRLTFELSQMPCIVLPTLNANGNYCITQQGPIWEIDVQPFNQS